MIFLVGRQEVYNNNYYCVFLLKVEDKSMQMLETLIFIHTDKCFHEHEKYTNIVLLFIKVAILSFSSIRKDISLTKKYSTEAEDIIFYNKELANKHVNSDILRLKL